MTNRNVRVSFAGTDTVVRLCGERTAALGINRETEELATRQAAALGVGPRVLCRLVEDDVLVCEYLPGTVLRPEQVRDHGRLKLAAGALRATHSGGPLPTAFAVFDLCHAQAAALGSAPPDGVVTGLALADRIRHALAGHPEHAPVPCHNDLLAANILDDEGVIWLLDWECAGMNDRFFDLANLAANNGFRAADRDVLLDTYFVADGGATDRRRAALGLMLVVSDLREALWHLTQRSLSDLDVDYDAHATFYLRRLTERAASPDLNERLSRAQTP